MSVTFTTTSQAALHGLKLLVYGESGAGKTTLCGTLDEATTLFISAENGLLCLRGKNFLVATVENYADVVTVYNALLNDPQCAVYTTVVLDSVSDIAEKLLVESKAKMKDPRQAFGDVQEKIIGICRAFRDLPGRNVIFTAKAENMKDELTGALQVGPSLPGQKLGPQLPYLFDEVFYLLVQETTDATGKKEHKRWLQTGRDNKYVAKDRSGTLDFWEAPNLPALFQKILTSTPSN